MDGVRAQTIGKRLVSIRVVDGDNQAIDIFRSVTRYCVLGVPFFLSGTKLTNEVIPTLWVYPISIVVFGGYLSILYLYTFNRVTRQSLHDLVLGTYVVNTDTQKSSLSPIWRPHLIVVAALFLASAVLPAFVLNFAENEPIDDLLLAQAALKEHPSVAYVSVSSGSSSGTSTIDGAESAKYLSVRAFLNTNSVTDTQLAKQLATTLVSNHTDAQQVDVIQIILIYGYDIVIASNLRDFSHTFNPIELTTDG